jgi:hypothetical protein
MPAGVGEVSSPRRLRLRPTSLLRRRDPRTEERKAVQIQRAATDLFNARQPLQFTTRDVEFTKAADTQYITRGGDGAPEQPGAPANAEAPASNKPVSLAKRARTCFLTAARPRR